MTYIPGQVKRARIVCVGWVSTIVDVTSNNLLLKAPGVQLVTLGIRKQRASFAQLGHYDSNALSLLGGLGVGRRTPCVRCTRGSFIDVCN